MLDERRSRAEVSMLRQWCLRAQLSPIGCCRGLDTAMNAQTWCLCLFKPSDSSGSEWSVSLLIRLSKCYNVLRSRSERGEGRD